MCLTERTKHNGSPVVAKVKAGRVGSDVHREFHAVVGAGGVLSFSFLINILSEGNDTYRKIQNPKYIIAQ